MDPNNENMFRNRRGERIFTSTQYLRDVDLPNHLSDFEKSDPGGPNMRERFYFHMKGQERQPYWDNRKLLGYYCRRMNFHFDSLC